MSTEQKRSSCPLSLSLDILGDKWTLLIIRDLIFFKKQYYNEFLSSSEKIATNILSQRLKSLESQNFVSKTRDPLNRSKNIYKVSQKGLDLLPVLLELMLWGHKHSDSAPLVEIMNRIKNNKAKFMEDILEKHKI